MPDWLVTNTNGVSALKLCNGNNSVADIAIILSKIAGHDVQKELLPFFEYVDTSTKIFTSIIETFHYQSYPLNTVQLSMTSKCNLKCVYCYATDRLQSTDMLNLDDYFSLINDTNKISKKVEIVFTGGEPLLSSYMLEVAEYAKKKGNDLQLLTNGLLIDAENGKRIAELFDLIKISVDGSTKEIHERHRGNNTFYKTHENIELLLRNNAKLLVAMTVTKDNIDDIEKMTTKFGSILRFSPLFMVGRAKQNNRLAISGREYYHALSSVKGVNPLGYLCSSLAQAKQRRIMKCAIGDAEISISEAGDVYPCHLLHSKKFLAGNVKTISLSNIYLNSDILRQCSKLNVLEIEGCKTCEIRFICGGACRARAFYETGDIKHSGRFCEYEKLAFINGLFEIHEM